MIEPEDDGCGDTDSGHEGVGASVVAGPVPTVGSRRITPPQAVPDHEDDPADDPTIIDREFDLADLRAAFEYQESGRYPRTAQGRVPSALTLGMRPTMELAQYRVPGAKGLYLSGPFMHPGGGLTGGG